MNHRLSFQDFELDTATRELRRAGAPVRIGSRALDVLAALAQAAPAPVSPEALLRAVWGAGRVDRNNLRVQVAALRKLLGADTIRHDAVHGYRFAWPVRPAGATPEAGALPVPGNLPEHAVALTGRDDALARLEQRLPEAGARVTLCGAPGIGKTTLAMAAAQRLRQRFEDGVWWVDLSALDGAADPCAAAALALGLHASAARAPARLAGVLAGRRLLLLLDNCEHLRDGVRALCDALLRAAPSVSVLCTSRRELKCAGEDLLPLAPLSLPQDDSLAAARASSAVALFEERARRADPRFALTAANAAAVCRIGRLLDGVPLAIHFAAARVPLWGVDMLERRLLEPIGRLGAAAAGEAARHRSPAETIRWSHELLGPASQELLAVLGAFAGTVPLDGLQAVAARAGIAAEAVVLAVSDLLDNSLLSADAASLVGEPDPAPGARAAQPRYVMHALVRDFAHQRLEARADAAALHRAHALWCRGVIPDTLPGEKRRPNDVMPPVADVGNLRKAIHWAVRHDTLLAMELCARMIPFWRARGMYEEGLALSLPLLEQAPLPEGGALVRARCRNRVCGLLLETEQYERMLATTRGALDDARCAANECEIAQAYGWMGLAHDALGALEESLAVLQTALDHSRRAGDRVLEGVIVANMGLLRVAQGDHPRAEVELAQAQQLAVRLDDSFIQAIAHGALGELAFARTRLGDALAHARAATACYRRLDMQYRVANSLNVQAVVELACGDWEPALRHLQEALAIAHRHGLDRMLAESLLGLAAVHLAVGEDERARGLFQRAEREFERLGVTLAGPYKSVFERCREALGTPALPGLAPSASMALAWAGELAARQAEPTS